LGLGCVAGVLGETFFKKRQKRKKKGNVGWRIESVAVVGMAMMRIGL
jgi:hypothetical protein